MSRAGREPAEDVKRRLVAGCQEVGLEVASARMYLMREHGVRVIHVAGQWSARHELAKIEKWYAAGGKVDFLDLDASN